MAGPSILVPGRAHDRGADGELVLSASSVARVEAVAGYYHANAADFEQAGIIRFEGGRAEAAAGMEMPPPEQREGTQMQDLAVELGVPRKMTTAGIWSRTTMENCLHARESFLGVASLLITTQLSQADRLLYCAGKALPGTQLSILPVAGEEDPAIMAEEERLLRQSKILYSWARSPRSLYIADRIGVTAGRMIGFRPGAKYSTATE